MHGSPSRSWPPTSSGRSPRTAGASAASGCSAAGLVLLVAWTGGTVAGVLGGSLLGDPATYGFDAMFPALFLALLVGQLGFGPGAHLPRSPAR